MSVCFCVWAQCRGALYQRQGWWRGGWRCCWPIGGAFNRLPLEKLAAYVEIARPCEMEMQQLCPQQQLPLLYLTLLSPTLASTPLNAALPLALALSSSVCRQRALHVARICTQTHTHAHNTHNTHSQGTHKHRQ